MFCDENCNECPIINHANSRLLTHVLNKLHDKFGNDVYKIVQNHCSNMTVCKDCRIDDFVHDKDCDLIKDCPDCDKKEGERTPECQEQIKELFEKEKITYYFERDPAIAFATKAIAICTDELIKAIDRNTDMMHETTQDLILCLNRNNQ